MEANIDNFINYTDSPSLFLSENFPDLNFDFRSPETEISLTNNPPATTPSHSSAPSNHFSNGHSMRGPTSHSGSDHHSPNTSIFLMVKMPKRVFFSDFISRR